MRAASSMTGHGVSSDSSYSAATGPDHVLREVVDPLLELELVLVEIQGEFAHFGLLGGTNGARSGLGRFQVTAR